MQMRIRDRDATRAGLLAAGARLATSGGMSKLTVGAVVETAGASKGAFFHHFPTREQFVLELHREFHDRMAVAVAVAIAPLAPGRERLMAGAEAYWTLCLRERGMRACLVEARIDPAIADEARARTDAMAAMVAVDLEALGVADPKATAPLVLAMISEVAAIEDVGGRALPATRRALEAMLPEGRS